MGLLVYAYPAARSELERATERFRLFREQPTPELARSAGEGLRSAISPNERLLQLFHPWTSYVIVPLFALANAGIAIDGGFLERGFISPITLGILFGYVVGKPVGVLGMSWLVTRLSRGRLRPPVGWAAVAGGGTIAGIGFTVSLLVATLAFDGPQLEEAKLGILSAALAASVVTWLLFRGTGLLPRRLRIVLCWGPPSRSSTCTSRSIRSATTCAGRSKHRSRSSSTATSSAPIAGRRSRSSASSSPTSATSLRWRHLPLNDVHPRHSWPPRLPRPPPTRARSGRCTTSCSTHQDALGPDDLIGYAEQLGLDVERFTDALREHAGAVRVAEDVDGADLSAVSGTPTFFINGQRHYGAYDIATLSAAVRAARARAAVVRA